MNRKKKEKDLGFETLKRTKLEEIILKFIQKEIEKAESQGTEKNIKDFTLDELRFYIQKKKKESWKKFLI